MSIPDIQQAKKIAAEKAVTYVENNMIVGLGTGSTAKFAIEFIGQRVAAGLKVQGVPTSLETERLAKENNIPLLTEFKRIDVTIDGADEVDELGNLIKGGGGALTREKIVAAACKKEIIIIDEAKLVATLGAFPLAVEVLPFGWTFIQEKLKALGCEVNLRKKSGETFLTDNQNYVLDCDFKQITEPRKLEREINSIPGVVENGLFVGLSTLVIIGKADGTTQQFVY